MHQRHNATLATIQIRNVPTDVHRTLRSRAAASGQSLQEYLLSELIDQARTRDLADILAEVQADVDAHPDAYSQVSSVSIIREDRESH